MPRKSRKELEASFFHTIVQGINGEYIFQEEICILEYLKLLHIAQNMFDVSIIAYCIMNNHAHLLLHTLEVSNLSKFMHYVNTIFAEYYNTFKERYGPVFRDRFLSEPITNYRYLLKCIQYIHLNPVKAKMVKKCEDYKFSSYQDFIQKSGNSQHPALKEMLGDQNFIISTDTIKNLDIFIDVNLCKDDILNNRLSEFLDDQKLSLQSIFKNQIELKKLILYLKDGYQITYVDISQFLKISKTTIFRLLR